MGVGWAVVLGGVAGSDSLDRSVLHFHFQFSFSGLLRFKNKNCLYVQSEYKKVSIFILLFHKMEISTVFSVFS